MKNLLFIPLVLILTFSLSSCVEKQINTKIDTTNYTVSFGIFEKDTFKLREITTQIPMIYKDTGFSIGYVIQSNDKSDFKEYSIAYPPRAGVAGDEIKMTDDKGLKGPIGKSTLGNVAHKFGFDKGDPDGEWLIDIYVNDQLLKSIKFEVIKQ